ncbi:hypothetical protein H6G93_30385 [Nostoc sp. FACHB-973]|nr:hypothetical protein [Nostoc sp. FACHB-973]
MTLASNGQTAIIRTERGLTIEGEDSLEQVMREENTPTSLPVVTIADPDRVLNDSIYRERCVDRLVEIVVYIGNYIGARRVFIP